MNKVAVVVLNWDGFDDTAECLKSLHNQSFKKFDIILIDNGSKDKQKNQKLNQFKADYPDLILIKNDKNLGFAGGVNTGIKAAMAKNYEFVALFNNDATADTDWLKNLLKAQKKHQSGITTGLFLHQDGKTIDSSGDQYSNWGLPFPRARNQKTENAESSGFVFSGSGGNSLYSIDMLKKIGLFDDYFFAYYEDSDISFRAQLAGYKVFYTKDALSYHKQGATSQKIPGFTVYQTFKNLPLLFFKNVPTKLFFSVGAKFWLAYILMAGNAIKNGNGKSVLKGYFHHLLIFWRSSFWRRFKIQASKKVSDDYIKSIMYADIPPDQTGLINFRIFFRKRR